MHQIGGRIESIAKRDLPLTEALTKITVHQLEQVVHFERAVRAGIAPQSGRSEAGSAASQVSSRASGLSQQADVLKAEVAKFAEQARIG